TDRTPSRRRTHGPMTSCSWTSRCHCSTGSRPCASCAGRSATGPRRSSCSPRAHGRTTWTRRSPPASPTTSASPSRCRRCALASARGLLARRRIRSESWRFTVAELNETQRYFIDEHVEDFREGHITRRELVRRVSLIAGSAALATTILAACDLSPRGGAGGVSATPGTSVGGGASPTASAGLVAAGPYATPPAQAATGGR